MQVDYQKEFLKFLKRKNLEDKFKSNIEGKANSNGIYTIEGRIQAEVEDGIPDEIVLGAFEWGATPEGVQFWWDIESKWKEKCKELLCK